MYVVRRKSGAVGFDEEAANAPVVWRNSWLFELCPDHGNVCNAARGDPHFFAIENIVVAVFARAGSHAPGIGAEVRFRETEAAEFLSRSHLRQPEIFLLIRAKGIDRIHDERRLYAHKAADARIAALEFLHQQPVFDVVHTRAAVAFERCAKEAEFAHGTHQLARKAAVAVALLDNGDEVVFDKGARTGADDKFVI